MADVSRIALISIILAFCAIIGIQIIGSVTIADHSREILDQIGSLPQDQLASEKTKQEVVALKIESETKALFWTSLLGSVGTFLAVLAALIGLWQGLRDYWSNREKERLDRAATDLNAMWEGLANTDSRVRAGAVVGLQHFFTPDKLDYHSRILSALAVTARLEKDPVIENVLTTTIQQGMRQVPWEILHQISWQGVRLKGINLSKTPLCKCDFRDAYLENANFQECDLSDTVFTAANLKGARLDNCRLSHTNLEYADLAGASLAGAALPGCNLNNAQVLNLDLEKTDLRGAVLDPDEFPWRLTKNWRHAALPEGIREHLVTQYGGDVRGKKVLMMIWEFPPFAIGGAWTAAYHIIRNLRRQGADLVVMVPWKRSDLNLDLFGNEVELVTLEIVPPAIDGAAHDRTSPQPYLSYGSPYSRFPEHYAYSPYESYSQRQRYSAYGQFSPYTGSDRTTGRHTSQPGREIPVLREGPISGLVRQFQRGALHYLRQNPAQFDSIYAADWLTFWAAEEVSRRSGKPWIAHFHSTEFDRRPDDPDEVIVAIEQRGARSADRILTPSHSTATAISKHYKIPDPKTAPDSKITVVPNLVSEEIIPVPEFGSYETKRVLFIGRLTRQKGPDLFVETCGELSRLLPSAHFAIHGSGEEKRAVMDLANHHGIDIAFSEFTEWESRGGAFGTASAVLVTSRSEPFGMVILEAMERGVPVLYPKYAGAAEVLKSGITINPEDPRGTAKELRCLLTDRDHWSEVVKSQSDEIRNYYSRNYADRLMDIFQTMPVSANPADHSTS